MKNNSFDIVSLQICKCKSSDMYILYAKLARQAFSYIIYASSWGAFLSGFWSIRKQQS